MSIFDSIEHTTYLDCEGCVEAVQPFEKIEISTAAGNLVPIYKVADHGRKKLTPIRTFKDGTVKSMALHQATVIPTSVGPISAELVTFYQSGAIRRVFPLNGKLSGFWSELNEYKLTRVLSIPTPIGTIAVRPIYLHFYETGELKSITFWPAERVKIQTPLGVVTIKRGVSFHRNGALASCEPATPLVVKTAIGSIEAYDPDPNGINGETNSLSFSDTQTLTGVSTINTVIKSQNRNSEAISFSPLVQRSRCSDTSFSVEPLKIKFLNDTVVFRNGMRPSTAIANTAPFSLEPFHTEKPLANVGASCSL